MFLEGELLPVVSSDRLSSPESHIHPVRNPVGEEISFDDCCHNCEVSWFYPYEIW